MPGYPARVGVPHCVHRGLPGGRGRGHGGDLRRARHQRGEGADAERQGDEEQPILRAVRSVGAARSVAVYSVHVPVERGAGQHPEDLAGRQRVGASELCGQGPAVSDQCARHRSFPGRRAADA